MEDFLEALAKILQHPVRMDFAALDAIPIKRRPLIEWFKVVAPFIPTAPITHRRIIQLQATLQAPLTTVAERFADWKFLLPYSQLTGKLSLIVTDPDGAVYATIVAYSTVRDNNPYEYV